ncbi:DUF4231 domain-containing protein [Nonomuraea sp. NPDC003201]
MSVGSVKLDNHDLPATFNSADQASLSGQRFARNLVKCELFCLAIAAATGLSTWRVGDKALDVLAAVGFIAFGCALIVSTVRVYKRPEDMWYAGRAAAESIKTLAWRYAVGGDPFSKTLIDRDVRVELLHRIEEIFAELRSLTLPPVSPNAVEITDNMAAIRALPFEDRKSFYISDRVSDQMEWYSKRAEQHRKAARTWTAITIASSAIGCLMGFLKFIGPLDVDVLGLGAAIASAATAWNQLNQHRVNYASYVVASRELSIIRDRARNTEESEWSAFVSDAEDAVSREHTMWLARHGHPGVRRGR